MAPEPQWRVLGQSVRGASHVRADLPNQDAITCHSAPGAGLPLVLVVSDGHGSAKSFRSDRGSRFAVDVTAGLLDELVAGLPGAERLSTVKRAAEEPLPKELVRRWHVAVDADLEVDPFTETELTRLRDQRGERGCASVGRNPRLAYGATVLGVLVTPEYLLFLQLGDGDILTVAGDGTVTRPLARDARLIANETTSLCMAEAWREVRMRFLTNYGTLPALILVATDGYANSFVNEAAFRQVGSDILAILREEGLGAVEEGLSGWLDEASSAGSGDDISVGLVVRLDALLKPVRPSSDGSTAEATPGAGPDEGSSGALLGGPCAESGDTDRLQEVGADERARFVARIKHDGPSEPSKRVGLLDVVAGEAHAHESAVTNSDDVTADSEASSSESRGTRTVAEEPAED